MDRLQALKIFYSILEKLEKRVVGRPCLDKVHGRMGWPRRGVYFFFEPGEMRTDSGSGMRVVRVGTHAVSKGAKSTLWRRLYQHKGAVKTGGGNHRGSVFRKLIGQALITRGDFPLCSTWDDNKQKAKMVKESEMPVEKDVSCLIRKMPFLWVDIPGEPGAQSLRSVIECNSIALLSNYRKNESLDPSSESWLGRLLNDDKVKHSGLWNRNYVDGHVEDDFLLKLEGFAEKTQPLCD